MDGSDPLPNSYNFKLHANINMMPSLKIVRTDKG
jgi:hypothetical protein